MHITIVQRVWSHTHVEEARGSASQTHKVEGHVQREPATGTWRMRATGWRNLAGWGVSERVRAARITSALDTMVFWILVIKVVFTGRGDPEYMSSTEGAAKAEWRRTLGREVPSFQGCCKGSVVT